MALAEAAAALGGRASGRDVTFTGVSTDSRTLGKGDLFVALRGERFDGHDFLKSVAAKAAAIMVDSAYRGEYPLPALVVGDTRRSLGDLARYWRARFAPALVAVTGSNGKTTVKEMLASVLRRHAGEAAVLATRGNLNNDIGLPLTLLTMRHAHRWCAIELGMNHKGEIAYLAGIAKPTVALVNNAQREHLEFMRSVDEVAAENASVYDALPPDGVAVINADDPHAALFRARAGARRSVEFGLNGARVTGRYKLGRLSSELHLQTPGGGAAVVGRLVTAVNNATGQRFQVRTGNTGGFTLKVPPGSYRVEVELQDGEGVTGAPTDQRVGASDVDANIVITVGPLPAMGST